MYDDINNRHCKRRRVSAFTLVGQLLLIFLDTRKDRQDGSHAQEALLIFMGI